VGTGPAASWPVAFGHQLQHLPLPLGELPDEVAPAASDDKLRDYLRVDRGSACGDSPHRVHELAHVRDTVLE